MKRSSSAVWQGDLKSGKGTLFTESDILKDTPYYFSTRFENAKGTNPEELIGAADAGWFAMALSAALSHAMHRRIRDVIQAPDGAVLLLTDAKDGELLRLTPASR